MKLQKAACGRNLRQIPTELTDTERYRQRPTCRGLWEFVGDLRYMPPYKPKRHQGPYKNKVKDFDFC